MAGTKMMNNKATSMIYKSNKMFKKKKFKQNQPKIIDDCIHIILTYFSYILNVKINLLFTQ